jgi:ATP-dependent Clp protease ATP-binding subunit ClpA
MFERFTHAAREAVVRAQVEARELGQSPVGTEHVLLALLAVPSIAAAPALRDQGVNAVLVRSEVLRRASSAAAAPSPADVEDADREALRAIGIDLDAVRRAIEDNFGPGALRLPQPAQPGRKGPMRSFFSSGHVPFSKRNKKVLELALREAIRLRHNYIAPEHIMLGLLREGQGLAARILAEREVDFELLRADLTRSLGSAAA